MFYFIIITIQIYTFLSLFILFYLFFWPVGIMIGCRWKGMGVALWVGCKGFNVLNVPNTAHILYCHCFVRLLVKNLIKRTLKKENVASVMLNKQQFFFLRHKIVSTGMERGIICRNMYPILLIDKKNMKWEYRMEKKHLLNQQPLPLRSSIENAFNPCEVKLNE